MFSTTRLTTYRNDRPLLKNVTFSLSAGEALLIQGPNGIGKSTLLKILAGFKKADTGQVLWNQKNILHDHADYTKQIGWLGHADALKPSLTIRENLLLHARLYKTDISEALDRLDLLPLINVPIRLLSSGQKRRTALARLLLKPARIWFLDEPSTGLDKKSIMLLADMFSSFRQQGGIILASTHIPLPLPHAQSLNLSRPSLKPAP